MTGRFITFEGIDGVGKSTQIKLLADHLQRQGQQVHLTREPGGTPLGEKIRQIVLTESMDALSELLLMFTARQQHLVSSIRPALAQGMWVLCDRFVDSSYAYQGGGRQVPWATIATLEKLVVEPTMPSLTILLTLPVAQATQRVDQSTADRFERESETFHQRVHNAFLRRAADQPHRILMINAADDLQRIHQQILQRVAVNG